MGHGLAHNRYLTTLSLINIPFKAELAGFIAAINTTKIEILVSTLYFLNATIYSILIHCVITQSIL